MRDWLSQPPKSSPTQSAPTMIANFIGLILTLRRFGEVASKFLALLDLGLCRSGARGIGRLVGASRQHKKHKKNQRNFHRSPLEYSASNRYQRKTSAKVALFLLSRAPVKIRTSNLLIRSQMLYPVELRVRRERLICGGRPGRQPQRSAFQKLA